MSKERLLLAEKGACKGIDTDLFFPIGEIHPREQVEEAKKICKSCPVRNVCLQVALQERENFGIWGGLTADERKAHQRRSIRILNTQKTVSSNEK